MPFIALDLNEDNNPKSMPVREEVLVCAASDAAAEAKHRWGGANEKPHCVKLTSANMGMHYEAFTL